jgi:hypothetical protein
VDGDVPAGYVLEQNYPNPFNPDTEIRYALPEDVSVTIKVYNVIGAEVATLMDAPHEAGVYSVKWRSEEQASGIYFCIMKAGQFRAARKMLLLK